MQKYFLGANTGGGFYSLFDELYSLGDGMRLFVIKGGPGTGKSGIMKRVAEQSDKNGYSTQRIFCSSDPQSLDAVIIPELKIAVADGTPPHTIEPKYPGAVEQTVNLGDCWDVEKLRSKMSEIKETSFECSAYHTRCIRFLKGFSALLNDSKRLILPCVDKEKLTVFAERLALRELKDKTEGRGEASVRFLSAVTPEGITFFEETLSDFDRIIEIDDPDGVVSDILLHYLAGISVKNGINIIVCPCITDPKRKLDHLLIPEKGLAFTVSNGAHSLSEKAEKTVSVKRFLDAQQLKAHSARLSFNRRAAAELLDEAALSLANAKAIHDELEEYYISAMDFDKVNQKAEKLINDIFK